ncbi:ABC transporter ATP-binding protein [Amycolatopsis thermoflava]
MSDLTVHNLTMTFGTNLALDAVSLYAADGELLTLLGPSGCGKSTTLWSIAGLHRPDSGHITVGETVFFDGRKALPPERRNCGVVFQSYAIWPHMTVQDNVGYPLKLRRQGAAARRRRVAEVLELVEMGAYATRYPHELSGGQQQRVALARALAAPPNLLLLDEPFSNLDAKLRDRAREWLKLLQRDIGVTTVFVTHDQDEALSMSDHIVVMNHGRVQQVGTPEEVYNTPANRFVADFVGTINLLTAQADGNTAKLPGFSQPLVIPEPRQGPLEVAIRSESVVVHTGDAAAETLPNVLTAPIVDRAFLGDHYRYWLQLGDQSLVVRSTTAITQSELIVRLPPETLHLFNTDTEEKRLHAPQS